MQQDKHCSDSRKHCWIFFKPRVKLSNIFPEFQGHLGNGTLVASISFSKIIKTNHKQPQHGKEGGGLQRCFKQPQIAALTKQLAPTHHDEPNSPGSTIVPEVLDGLPLSDVAKLPGSNVG